MKGLDRISFGFLWGALLITIAAELYVVQPWQWKSSADLLKILFLFWPLLPYLALLICRPWCCRGSVSRLIYQVLTILLSFAGGGLYIGLVMTSASNPSTLPLLFFPIYQWVLLIPAITVSIILQQRELRLRG